MRVFELVFYNQNATGSLSNFEKFIMVLTKLRLGTPMQDLAYRFNTSASTVSRVFRQMLHLMYVRLKPFVFWPNKDALIKSMPDQFKKHFGNQVAVIIDCFEVFIEQPSSLLARAQTYSNYKHHNTIKLLIGVTPRGMNVSFISKSWGGRCSDKFITENSGFLQFLSPGDIVLADRGFTIGESVATMGSELRIPAFTRGKNQLSPMDLERTRKIGSLRIHVERVIGLLRNRYTILRTTLPTDYLRVTDGGVTTIDKIVFVTCALTNFNRSIVTDQ